MDQTSPIRQFYAMMYKSLLFTLNNWKLTCLQLFSPIIFITALIAINSIPKAIEFNMYNPFPRQLEQEAKLMGKIDRCVVRGN